MRTAALAFGWLILTACGGGASTTSVMIGSGGGMVVSDGVTLMFPPGALTADTMVSVAVSGACPAAYTCLSPVYTFEPSGTTFATPVAVSMDFSGAAAADAILTWSSPGGTTYSDLPTAASGSTVSAQITHFSQGFVSKRAVGSGCTSSAQCAAGQLCVSGTCVAGP
jgi:ZU5 domain